ncbi:uncharacterized protein LOC124278098 [Haliotis rubra]|uniref:uncharacterized protein LOC124278098 n=1 Tax=Haliotis rubra TaxID=36100 RepID=UPI001EE591D7|nr:uncharacterized protein LOC124278098 [Haliotis rubra]
MIFFSIDATDANCYGRYVNDSITNRKANFVMKALYFGGNTHSCLFDKREISSEEELTYYYGPTDENMYWRKRVLMSSRSQIMVGHNFLLRVLVLMKSISKRVLMSSRSQIMVGHNYLLRVLVLNVVKHPIQMKSISKAAGAALLPVSKEVNMVFKECVLDKVHSDTVSLVVRNDDLIVQYGCRLFNKCASNVHQYQYVRQKMRELGRFLLCARETKKGIVTLSDCIKPQLFNEVIASEQRASQFTDDKCSFGIPSLALKLGHSLRKCSKIVNASALKSQDETRQPEAKAFLELCECEWDSASSSVALQTLQKWRFNAPKRIPLAEDIRKMNEHLEEAGDTLLKLIISCPSQDTWRNLAEVVLAQVVLFNRRGGETERMELKHYTGRMTARSDLHEEVALSLSSFE